MITSSQYYRIKREILERVIDETFVGGDDLEKLIEMISNVLKKESLPYNDQNDNNMI